MTKSTNPAVAIVKDPKNAVESAAPVATPAATVPAAAAPKTSASTARKTTTRRARTTPAKSNTAPTSAESSAVALAAPSAVKANPATATKAAARKPAATKTATAKPVAKPIAAKADTASTVADVPMAKVTSKRKAAVSVDDLETLATHLLSEQSSAAPQAKMGKKLDKASQLPAKKAGKKAKLIRDSFTFPEADYALIAALKQRVIGAGLEVKKSELIRAGLNALSALADEELHKMLHQLEKIKTGRPAK
ncbi:hypothetical protein [Deefgea piscis]|uniref:hypothetical protein n=1 Tax=Deefgea piscis TaxID=2739061 RepID=UPI001C804557|nr:hypothetical protein [Deefgea piscis]QZA82125.1 hypothetical protein K4H25_05635 [Deefgea piscis]